MTLVNDKIRKREAFIDAKLEVMEAEGRLPKRAVTIIRDVGPSKLNAGENGEQKTFCIGNVPRYAISPNAISAPIRKKMFPEMIRTNRPQDAVEMVFRDTYPGKEEWFYEFINYIAEHFFSSAQSAYMLSIQDYKDLCEFVWEQLKDENPDEIKKEFEKVKKEKKAEKLNPITEKIVKVYEDNEKPFVLDKYDGIYKAFYSNMATDRKHISGNVGGLYRAYGYSVTPFKNESNYTAATDTLIERYKNFDRDVPTGSIGLFSESVNSNVLNIQYMESTRTMLGTLMRNRNLESDDAWEDGLRDINKMSAETFKNYVTLLPETGQHNKYTMPEPAAVLVTFTNGEPYTSDSVFSEPIREENPALIATNRLMKFAASGRNFEVPGLLTKKYAIIADQYEDRVQVPDNVQKVTFAEMIKIIENGVVLS